jgi:hypothetical protein
LGASNTIDDPNATDGPIFRSFNPTLSPTRTFPRLSDLVHNTTVRGEVLPAVSRTLSFRLTVRDNGTNSANVGGLCFDEFAITVDGNSGPLTVTYPTDSEVWMNGTQETVTWDVAGTDIAPVNATEVDIFLSIDGGLTYPMQLADNVPNNGMAVVDVPLDINTVEARIKVKASDNIFFDISNINFLIGENNGLPIEWLNVHAAPQQTDIQLTWATASEVNNMGFEVQRSAENQQHFHKIAWVDAPQDNKDNETYEWIDREVIANTTYYYRLKQVDENGKADFSKIVTARLLNSTEDWDVLLSPNPTQDKINVQVLGLENPSLIFELYEMDGRLLETYTSVETINLSVLPAGIYVLKIWNGDRQLVKRLVKE